MSLFDSVALRAFIPLCVVLMSSSAHAQSCAADETDCGGDMCCPSDKPVCFTAQDKCCASEFPNLCSDNLHCGSTQQDCDCLVAGGTTCGDGCAPAGTVCCDDGSYCPAGNTCGCGGYLSLGEVCCDDGKTCAGGKQCACGGCTDPEAVCCPDGSTCSGGQQCDCGGCVDPGSVCCSDGTTCPSGDQCLCGGCAPSVPGLMCCGTSVCNLGQECCGSTCMPSGSVCCGGTTYCPSGTTCVGTTACQSPGPPTCPAGYPINCGDGYCCPTDTTCSTTTGQCTSSVAKMSPPPDKKVMVTPTAKPGVEGPSGKPGSNSGGGGGSLKWGCSTTPGFGAVWAVALMLLARRRRVAVLAIALASMSAFADETCSDGREKSDDTSGHCCWRGQAWSNSRNRCVGIPVECPSGTKGNGDACVAVCADGQSVTAETAGHCCWPTQVWSNGRNACVGIPQCPSGQHAEGETCVSAATCADGQSRTADTAGHCCWPSQVWSSSRSVCVGVPQCPSGQHAEGESCVAGIACDPGMVSNPDTAGRCCWPNQVWSNGRAVCIGVPACPSGSVAQGETCVAGANAPPSGDGLEVPAPPPAPPSSVAGVETGTAEAPPALDFAWHMSIDVLIDVATSRIGARIRADIPFSDGPSTLALGFGAGALVPSFSSPSDNTWVFPLEVLLSYRIGIWGGRFQIIPRTGVVAPVLLDGSTIALAVKLNVGAMVRYAFGAPGSHFGVTLGGELLIPLLGAGWVFMIPVGLTF